MSPRASLAPPPGQLDLWLAPEAVAPHAPVPSVVLAPDAVARLWHDDAGTFVDPDATAWADWISASATRNHLLGDPLLDWLRRHGLEKGLVPDDQRPGFDPRLDFHAFILEKGHAFEAGVLRILSERAEVLTVAHGPADSRSVERATATIAAMASRVPIISQGVLRDPQRRAYGMPDLLVRSDILAELFPGLLDEAVVHEPAPLLGLADLHYVAVDIKFHTFDLLVDGHCAGGDRLPYMGQVWLYNEMLGRVAGSRPRAGYLLGRSWTQGKARGTGCLERLARVDAERELADGRTLAEAVEAALDWQRRLRADGATWGVTPAPSVPELYPHARHAEDAPWHAAKGEIAKAIGELTLLPRMNPAKRRAAHASGLVRWDAEGVTVEALGLKGEGARLCDAVLVANREPQAVVLPRRFTTADPAWRTPAPLEVFVDFETVSSLDDDFSRLPLMGGRALVFQVGAGHLDADGTWRFAQWTADRLTLDGERAVIDGFMDHLVGLAAGAGIPLESMRVVHWSAAETSNLETAWDSARRRHPDADWPRLPWWDALVQVVRAEPLAIKGAFGFGLKAIAKAMHAAGLIATSWDDGPGDGLGAMVAAWVCEAEARRTGAPMPEQELMVSVASYNAVDVRVMAEILDWLRVNR